MDGFAFAEALALARAGSRDRKDFPYHEHRLPQLPDRAASSSSTTRRPTSRSLAAILKEKGYQISVATNGKQALEVMARVQPDLILLDVMMPEMDGFETCRQLKATEQWRQIPVIFLTAKTETADIVQGFELGAVDYVAKPFNAHELLARVNTHLTMDELRRSLAAKNAGAGPRPRTGPARLRPLRVRGGGRRAFCNRPRASIWAARNAKSRS